MKIGNLFNFFLGMSYAPSTFSHGLNILLVDREGGLFWLNFHVASLLNKIMNQLIKSNKSNNIN